MHPLLWCSAIERDCLVIATKAMCNTERRAIPAGLLSSHRSLGGLDQPVTLPRQSWWRSGLPNMLNDRVLSSVYTIGQVDGALDSRPVLTGASPWPPTYIACSVTSARIGTPMSRQFAGWHVKSST